MDLVKKLFYSNCGCGATKLPLGLTINTTLTLFPPKIDQRRKSLLAEISHFEALNLTSFLEGPIFFIVGEEFMCVRGERELQTDSGRLMGFFPGGKFSNKQEENSDFLFLNYLPVES